LPPEYEVSDEQAQAAKEDLEVAIRNYYAEVEPDVMVTSWVLIAHKVSDDMDAEGVSSVGTLVATGQAFPMTRGLMDVAIEADKDSLRG
jgi:hypothetical protein